MAIIVQRKPVNWWWAYGTPWLTDAQLINGWPWGWGASRTTNGPFKCSGCRKRHSSPGLYFAEDDIRCAGCAEESCKETYTKCLIKLAPWKQGESDGQ